PLLDRAGIEMREVHEDRPVADRQIGVGRNGLEFGRDTGDACALVEHPAVADHDQRSDLAYFLQRRKPGRELRADAVRTALGQCNARLGTRLMAHVIGTPSDFGPAFALPRSARTICRISGSNNSATPATTRPVTRRLAKKIDSDPFDISIDW